MLLSLFSIFQSKKPQLTQPTSTLFITKEPLNSTITSSIVPKHNSVGSSSSSDSNSSSSEFSALSINTSVNDMSSQPSAKGIRSKRKNEIDEIEEEEVSERLKSTARKAKQPLPDTLSLTAFPVRAPAAVRARPKKVPAKPTTFSYVDFQHDLHDWNYTNPFKTINKNQLSLPATQFDELMLTVTLLAKIEKGQIAWATVRNVIKNFTDNYRTYGKTNPFAELSVAEQEKVKQDAIQQYNDTVGLDRRKHRYNSLPLSMQQEIVEKAKEHYNAKILGCIRPIAFNQLSDAEKNLVVSLRNKTKGNKKHISHYLPYQLIYQLNDMIKKKEKEQEEKQAHLNNMIENKKEENQDPLYWLQFHLEHRCAELAQKFAKNYLIDAQGRSMDENGKLRPYLKCGTVTSSAKLSIFNVLSIFKHYVNNLVEYIHHKYDTALIPADAPNHRTQPRNR